MKKLIILLFTIGISSSIAQEGLLEIVRSEVKTEKKVIIADNMELTMEEEKLFWPIYNEYEGELRYINDRKISAIRKFAANYDTMTDDKAKELTKEFFAVEKDRLNLRKKYFKKMDRDLSTVTAAQFLQVENQISKLADVLIANELPLIHSEPEMREMEERE